VALAHFLLRANDIGSVAASADVDAVHGEGLLGEGFEGKAIGGVRLLELRE
jgi:hypothetical protein